MSYPANGGLMFDGRSLDDVFMYELPADGMQKPSTDGSVASSTGTTCEPEPLQKEFGDVHEPCTY